VAVILIANSNKMETYAEANDYELEYERNCADTWEAYTSYLNNQLSTSQVSDSDHVNEL